MITILLHAILPIRKAIDIHIYLYDLLYTLSNWYLETLFLFKIIFMGRPGESEKNLEPVNDGERGDR